MPSVSVLSRLRAQHDSETKVLEAALAPVMAKQVKYGGLIS